MFAIFSIGGASAHAATARHSIGNQIDSSAEQNCLSNLEPEDAAIIDELDNVNRQAAAGLIPTKVAASLSQKAIEQSAAVKRPDGSTSAGSNRKKLISLAAGFGQAANLKKALREAAEDFAAGKQLSPNRLAYLREQAVTMGLGDNSDEAFAALKKELTTSGAQVASTRKALRAAGVQFDDAGTPDLSDFDSRKLSDPAVRAAFVAEFPEANGRIDEILDPDRAAPVMFQDMVFLPARGKKSAPTLTPSEYHEAVLSQLRAVTEATGYRVFNSKQGGGITGLGTEVVAKFGGSASTGDLYRQAQATDSNTAARAFSFLIRDLGVGATNPDLMRQLSKLMNAATRQESANLDQVQSSLRKNAAAVVVSGALLPFVAGPALTAAGLQSLAVGAGLTGATMAGQAAFTSYQNGSNFLCELSRDVDENGAVALPLILAGGPLAKVPGKVFESSLRYAPTATKALYQTAQPLAKAAAAALRIGAVRQLVLGGAIAAPTAYFASKSEKEARATEHQARQASMDGHSAEARALQRTANSQRATSIVTSTTGIVTEGAQVTRQLVGEAQARKAANNAGYSEFTTDANGQQVNSRNGLPADLTARNKSRAGLPETPGISISAKGRGRTAEQVQQQYAQARATGNTAVVGDIHLGKGKDTDRNFKTFLNYVGDESNGVKDVVIGGDIVDATQFKKFDERLVREVEAVKQVRTALDATQGGSTKKIRIVLGNHDIGRKNELTSSVTGKTIKLDNGRFDIFQADGKAIDSAKAQALTQDYFGGKVSVEDVIKKYGNPDKRLRPSFTNYGEALKIKAALEKIPGVEIITQDFNDNAIIDMGGAKVLVGHVPQTRGPNQAQILGNDFDFEETVKLGSEDKVSAVVTFDKHTTGYIRGYKLDANGNKTAQTLDVVTNPALIGDDRSRMLGNSAGFTIYGHQTGSFHFVGPSETGAATLLDLNLDEVAYQSPAADMASRTARSVRKFKKRLQDRLPSANP